MGVDHEAAAREVDGRRGGCDGEPRHNGAAELEGHVVAGEPPALQTGGTWHATKNGEDEPTEHTVSAHSCNAGNSHGPVTQPITFAHL